jgi:hypothetical protein
MQNEELVEASPVDAEVCKGASVYSENLSNHRGRVILQNEELHEAPVDRLKAPVRLPFLPQGTFVPCHVTTLACILLQQYADENDPLHFATGCVLTAMVVLLLTLGVCGTNIIYTYGAHKYSCLHTNHWL